MFRLSQFRLMPYTFFHQCCHAGFEGKDQRRYTMLYAEDCVIITRAGASSVSAWVLASGALLMNVKEPHDD